MPLHQRNLNYATPPSSYPHRVVAQGGRVNACSRALAVDGEIIKRRTNFTLFVFQKKCRNMSHVTPISFSSQFDQERHGNGEPTVTLDNSQYRL